MLSFPSNRPIDVICLGRVNVDLYAIEAETDLQKVSAFTKSIGGSPANIAVGLSRLGRKVALVSRVGDDPLGEYIRAFLEQEKLDTSHLFTDLAGYKTSLAIVEVKQENSSVVFYRKYAADKQLVSTEIDPAFIAKTKSILISGSALSAPKSRQALEYVIEIALQHDVRIFMDIDYRPSEWESIQEASEALQKIAIHTDLLVGTVEEFQVINGQQANASAPSELLAPFLQQQTKIAILKDGKKGSKAYLEDGSVVDCPAFKVKALKNYGAGDAFLAAFCNGILNDKPIKEALREASAAAAIVVSTLGCAEAMPTSQELAKFIQQYSSHI